MAIAEWVLRTGLRWCEMSTSFLWAHALGPVGRAANAQRWGLWEHESGGEEGCLIVSNSVVDVEATRATGAFP